MGTLSSLTGGSGGGGGDPTGKFQASATVANGDLVVLNDNGTVAPVTSTNISENMTLSDNGTKLFASSSGNNYSGPHSWAVHNATNGYLFVINEGGGNIYHRIKYGSYSSGTGQYSLTSGNVISGYTGWLSQLGSPSDGYLYMYGGNSSIPYVRGIRWTGSSYTWTSERSLTDHNNSNVYAHYISASGEGSSDYVAVSMLSSGNFGVTHGTWDGSSSTPTRHQSVGSTNALSPYGNAFTGNWISGVHVKNDVHVIMLQNTSNIVKIIPIEANSSGVTYPSSVTDTGLTQQSSYRPSMAYDPVENIGIYSFKQNGYPRLYGFSVNPSNLSVTLHGEILSLSSSNYAILSFNPTARKFVVTGHNPVDDIKTFTYTSGGVLGTVTTIVPHPSANIYTEDAHLAPVSNSGNMILTFNSGSNPTSNYIDAANHQYATQFGLPYVDTNVDNYFGEAKEAISSGAAGSVAILNRTKDIADSTFQKGQKLFANPSGTALATSGTYRVGHATDGDTVLVLGDPS